MSERVQDPNHTNAIARVEERSDEGHIKQIIGECRPSSEGIAALQAIANRGAAGKIILTFANRELT